MSTLKVEIKWWYRPFIRFMPNFWEKLPEEKEGKWTTEVVLIPFSFVGTQYTKGTKGLYTSLQKAYLRARWRAFWVDLFDFSEMAIYWLVKKID